jgi:hypothetical protein
MDPLELSARFALPPNSRRYCGKRTFAKALSAFLWARSPSSRKLLESELKKFKAHYSYLSLIARANNLSPFSPGVSEALWLGNKLLDKVRNRDLQKLIAQDFNGPSLLAPKKARAIASLIPARALPHHSFHPLFIGSITGVVRRSLPVADSCRPSWGKVVSANGQSALLKSQTLVRKAGTLILIPSLRKVKLSCAGIQLISSPKKGDLLATHWGIATMKLTRMQAKSLEKYTKLNLLAANTLGKRLK